MSFKSIFSSTAHKIGAKKIAQKDSEILKDLLMEIYEDVLSICDKNNLTLVAAYGTVLGAVRHSDFIPWDDDMDFMMLRTEYEKFIVLFEESYSDKYNIQCAWKTPAASFGFCKIRLKNSLFEEIESAGLPIHKGIFLDIFPLENTPNNSFKRNIHGLTCNLLNQIKSSVFLLKYKSDPYEKILKTNRKAWTIYILRKIFGIPFSFLSPEKWNIITDKVCSAYKLKSTKYVAIPYGVGRYFGNLLKIDEIFPPIKHSFRYTKIDIPCNWEKYLKDRYGDYKTLPPKEKREQHLLLNFKVP